MEDGGRNGPKNVCTYEQMNKKKGIVKQYITNKLTHTKKLNNKNNT
jgi:hypothetical protein